LLLREPKPRLELSRIMIKLFIRLSWLRRSLRDSEEELDISLEDGWELLIEELSDMLEDLELDISEDGEWSKEELEELEEEELLNMLMIIQLHLLLPLQLVHQDQPENGIQMENSFTAASGQHDHFKFIKYSFISIYILYLYHTIFY